MVVGASIIILLNRVVGLAFTAVTMPLNIFS
jgi:hypothetical protein